MIISKIFFMSSEGNSDFYCFGHSNGFAAYPVSIFIRKNLPIKHKMNHLIRKMTENGIIEFWTKNYLLKRKVDNYSTVSPLSLQHTSSLVLVIPVGFFLSNMALLAEIVIFKKSSDAIRRRDRKSFWNFLSKLVDGERQWFIFLDNIKEEARQRWNLHTQLILTAKRPNSTINQ